MYFSSPAAHTQDEVSTASATSHGLLGQSKGRIRSANLAGSNVRSPRCSPTRV